MLQDGYPRTTQQAKDLDTFQKVDKVVNITLPEHVLLAKMLARRVCGDCGKGYNLANIQEGAYHAEIPQEVCSTAPLMVARRLAHDHI